MELSKIIENFNENNSFNIWRIKMHALLKQGMWAPLGESHAPLEECEFKLQEETTHSTILLLLFDEIICEVSDKNGASRMWLRLDFKYMTKSLTNKVFLKQHLSSLRVKEGQC